MKDELVYRRYKKGDEYKIIQLWKKTFADAPVEMLNLKYWEWIYRDNPLHDSKIWLAFDGKKLVGHYAVVPFEFLLNGKTVRVGHSVDSMTDEDYRNRGIFSKLANLTYKDCKDVCFFYCYPNEVSYNILKKKLNWLDVGTVPSFIRPLEVSGFFANNNVPYYLARLLSLPFRCFNLLNKKSKFEVRRIEFFDDKVEELLKKCFKPKLGDLKSKEYLNWRFAKHPKRKYDIFVIGKEELLGYVVCRFHKQFNGLVGVIMDIAGVDNDVVDSLINHSLSYFKEKQAHFALCMMSKNNPYYRRLYRYGFFRIPGVINPRRWKLIVRLNDESCGEQALDKKNWFTALSENDVP